MSRQKPFVPGLVSLSKLCSNGVILEKSPRPKVATSPRQKRHSKIPNLKLRPSEVKAFAFNSSRPIEFAGVFLTTVANIGRSRAVQAEIGVVDGPVSNLLGYKTATELGIVPIINSIDVDHYKSRFPNLFSGKVGKLKDYKMSFHVDPSIQPTKQQHYRVPYHLREKVDLEIDKLESHGLIEKAVGPTTWISPIHVVPKKQLGEIRKVVDARKVNKAIKRVRHVTPTLDDLVVKLNGASCFSKIDFNSGYRQIELDEKSRDLTTISTH